MPGQEASAGKAVGVTQIQAGSGKRRAGTHRPEARKMPVFWPGAQPLRVTECPSSCKCHRYPLRASYVPSVSPDTRRCHGERSPKPEVTQRGEWESCVWTWARLAPSRSSSHPTPGRPRIAQPGSEGGQGQTESGVPSRPPGEGMSGSGALKGGPGWRQEPPDGAGSDTPLPQGEEPAQISSDPSAAPF